MRKKKSLKNLKYRIRQFFVQLIENLKKSERDVSSNFKNKQLNLEEHGRIRSVRGEQLGIRRSAKPDARQTFRTGLVEAACSAFAIDQRQREFEICGCRSRGGTLRQMTQLVVRR